MSDVSWQITMLGPSRVGKTSLLTALQVGAQNFFKGTAVTVMPVDAFTAAAFRNNNDKMLGELAARRFSPDSLPGGAEEHLYELAVDPGLDDIDERQVLSFVDYPGGWISDNVHEDIVRKHLSNSPTVIIPIDATLIMESRPAQLPQVAKMLEITAVTDHVRLWATKRREGEDDPTLLVLAPIKCESYFSDNGGTSDRAEELLARVRDLYYPVSQAYRDESGANSQILYAPVDTVAPVEIMDVEWVVDEATGESRMVPTYKVRSDSKGHIPVRSIRGAEPILSYLVRDLLAQRDRFMKEERASAELETKRLERERMANRSNWWGRLFDSWSGRQARRAQRTEEQLAKIDKLDAGLRQLASNVDRATRNAEWNRVREW